MKRKSKGAAVPELEEGSGNATQPSTFGLGRLEHEQEVARAFL